MKTSDDEVWIECEECGNEQPDMGRNVACEECGALMPEPEEEAPDET